MKASGGTGVELNPIWFKRFHIDKVPAVVVVPKGSACFKSDSCHQERDYDVMTGDITLSAALKVMRDRGQFTQSIVQEALNQLQDASHA